MKKFLCLTAMLIAVAVPVSSASAQFEALRKFAQGDVEESKKIAYFQLRGPVVETPTALPPLFGDQPPVSMKSILGRLKEARLDANVVGVVVDLQASALGPGQIAELHSALQKFAAVEKEVYVHVDSLDTLTYLAATGASRVSMVPTGELWLTGLYGEAPYLRETLDWLGIYPDFEHMGAYKSAAETLTRSEPSPEAENMTDWLFDSLYRSVIEMISEGRGIPAEKVESLIDNGPYTAEEALAAGLIDAVEHRQDFASHVKNRYREAEVVANYGSDMQGMDVPQDLPGMFSFFMELMNPSEKQYRDPSVAIVYVDGAIMTGQREVSPFGVEGAFSETIRRALDKAAEDSTVKAVVLRVNSPGGSALASEIILDASKRVARRKPLVVSMGDVAASGGYYVACGADTIFADRTTITGSIGVVGGKLVTTEGWHKLGVNWEAERRGAHAGMLSSMSRFSEGEREKFIAYMQNVYDQFKEHVVNARGKRLAKPIDEIAGGRVYTGAQARELGLIDQIGGLEDAIAFAARQAGLGEYETRVIPDPPTIFDLFMPPPDDDQLAQLASSRTGLPMDLGGLQPALASMYKIDPQRVEAVLMALQRIALVHDEQVIMMMPHTWVIR